jgi:ABC-type multidrug transport system permease subunit
MNIMFGSMFGVGYVIVRYRKNGVLKRLRSTPLSAFQFLFAQVFSRMLLMLVTSLIVIGGAVILIGFKLHGSWIDLSLFLAVGSASMISLGLIVAARIQSEEAAEGILNLMTWPMIFLSGVWFSIDGASRWVLYGAKMMPLTYVVDGLRAIMIDGVSISQLAPQITVLLCLSTLFIVISSLIFRWR